jgi:hypothetical protein
MTSTFIAGAKAVEAVATGFVTIFCLEATVLAAGVTADVFWATPAFAGALATLLGFFEFVTSDAMQSSYGDKTFGIK